MTISIIHVAAAVSLALATTAARPTCSRDSSASASQIAANAPATPAPAPTVAATAGPGLPADFPIAPGLSPCRPVDAGGEIVCEWHGVQNGHAIYTFYHDALPRAGYTLLRDVPEVTTPHYMGAIGFTKGTAKGAVTIAGGDLTIQYLPHE